jgi:hypothetical protein
MLLCIVVCVSYPSLPQILCCAKLRISASLPLNMDSLTATEPHQCVTIRMGDTGAAAVPALTIVETFLNTVQKHGQRTALAQKKKINVIRINSMTILFSSHFSF